MHSGLRSILTGSLLPALLFLSQPASSDEISRDFSIRADGFETVTFEGSDLLLMDGGTSCFEAGQPDLPATAFTFVIPQGMTAVSADFEILSETVLDGRLDILPVRVSPIGSAPGPFVRNPEIYLSDEVFPGSSVVALSTGSRTGFRLATVQFTPFSYNPITGTVTVVTGARITLALEDDPAADLLSLTDAQVDNAQRILENIVCNPMDLSSCRPSTLTGGQGSDWGSWVAIGAAAHETTLQPLVDHRNATGLSAEFVSTEWITANYTGYDTQEKIRNYLIDAFEDHGLMYALIIGDWGETQRISSLNVGGGTVLNETSDLYYSDLDGTWDLDGDHLYGENTDNINYFADIAVGRFSTNVPAQVTTMVQKTVEYETISPTGTWRTRALLCGAGLWPESGYWGSFVCDSICARIPSSWIETKLYETSGGHPTNQVDVINEGVSYISPQGHGFSSGIYWYNNPSALITNSNYINMTNWGMFPVIHSIACLAGQLSASCIGERLMFSANGGAVGVMFNSNNGFGSPPTMGPSEHLEVHFANQMFVYGIQRVGDMQAAAKDAFKAAGGMSMQNWVLQENNLLGDPALLFITSQTGIEEGSGSPSAQPVLSAVSPNPASGSFSVGWSLPAPGPFTVSVYDVSGRLVGTLNHDAEGITGILEFEGTDGDGAPLSTGCYLIRLDAPSGSASSSMVYLSR